MLSNGFLPVERIVVREFKANEEDDRGYFIVLEGNRHVATLKWLQADHSAGIEVPEQVVETFASVPVIVLESADESTYWGIMGIRHVGGVKEWGGHQAARLVYELDRARSRVAPRAFRCRRCPNRNSRRNDPSVEGAYVRSNRRPIPP